MPNWKKLLYSGSNGSLNTLNISTALTASGLIYPATDGTAGQAIVTDGSGSLSFTTITSGTTTDTGSLLATASAAGSTITFEKGDGSTFDVTISTTVTPDNALVTASIAGSTLTFEKGDTSTFDLTLPAGGYSGSNATAHLNQTVAAATWSFAHNLDDRYPVFTVFDSTGDIIIPNRIETVDVNNANIYFTTARTGTATAVIASSISQISSITSDFTNQTTVAVTHSLDTRNIHVSVYDTNHSLVIPESITLDTLDTVVVTFPTAKSGTVVVAKGGHVISGSAATAVTASYALTASYVESGAGFPFSGSAEITGSILVSGSFVDFTDATVISGSTFSGSFVGDGSQLTGIATNLAISGSVGSDSINLKTETLTIAGDGGITSSMDAGTNTLTILSNGIVSSSAQIASDISGSFTSLSSSLEQRLTLDEGSITALNAATSSYLLNTTDTLTGDLTVTGTITAQEFHTEFVSASIIYQSGSTKFGDTLDDIHNFTGSVNITGSVIADSFAGDGALVTGVISSSHAIVADTASFVTSSNVYGPLGANSILSSSYSLTSSYNVNPTVSGSISGADWIDLTVGISQTVPHAEGRIFYDDENGSLAVYNDEADITLQVGQEFWKRVFNNTGNVIPNGTPVRISGSQGDYPYVWPATSEDIYSGTYDSSENKIIGLATHDIGISSTGYVTEKGIVRGVDTTAFAAGDVLYLETGSSGLRNTPPPFPYDVIKIGEVVRSQANGFIEVTPLRPLTSDSISGVVNIQTEVLNDESVEIPKGTPVHVVSEGNGPIPRVKIAKANDPTLMPATFVTTEAIPSGSQGIALTLGYITGVDTSTFTVGDIVYVAPTGGYTNQKPTGSNELIQNLGVVLKSDATNGSGFMYGAGRANDVPNLAGGKIWVGDESSHFVTSSIITLNETGGQLQVTGSSILSGSSHFIQGATTYEGSIYMYKTGDYPAFDPVFQIDSVSNNFILRQPTLVLPQLFRSSPFPSTNIDTGSLHYHLDNNKPYFYNGTDWVEMGISGSQTLTGDKTFTGNVTITGELVQSGSSHFYGNISGADILWIDDDGIPGIHAYTDIDVNGLYLSSSIADLDNFSSSLDTTLLNLSGSFSGSFYGDGTGLTGLGYGDTKKLNQTVAATTWSFNHNMNEQYPTVTVYNDLNEVIQPSKIEAVSSSSLNLYFGSATAGTAVAVVGGVALTQEAGFNRTLSQTVAATTWSFAHNLGQKYPQITVFDSNDELIIPGKVEAVDQNNAILYFDTAQAGTVAATVGGTAMTASYSDTLIVTDTLLSSQKNTDVDTGTEAVATVSTTLYDGAFFDYVIKDSTGGSLRAGTVTAVWSAPEIQYTETSTSDIGDTSGVTLAVEITGSDAHLRATTTTDNWNIKAFVRAL